MADKYTYADVIIDPNDPRVEIGAEYYAATSISGALRAANEKNEGLLVELDSVNREPTKTLITSKPFTVSYKHGNGGEADFLIRKKPEYVPFDLSNEEDRKALMGKTIKANNRPFSRQYVEFTISCFELVDKGAEGVGSHWEVNGIKEDELFHDWTFLDGTKCGKLTEED